MSHAFSRLAPALVVASTLSLALLTGCGANSTFSSPTAPAIISGKIFGGQQPVANSTVTVWSVGSTDYGSAATPLAHTTSLADGSFAFAAGAYTCPTLGTQVYITAQGGNALPDYTNPNLKLAAGLGDCSTAQSQTVNINEVSTAVTAFALAQFFTPTLGAASTDSFGTNATDLPYLTLSNTATIPTLLNLPLGTVNANTGSTTIDAAKIYSIANTLAACVNDASGFGNCATLFTDTTPPGGATAPTDTLQAAVQMALYPYQNVSALYKLASATPPFVGLGNTPNDWTVGVSYTVSSLGLGITDTATSATSASIDIDSSGHIWFPTNVSGNGGIAYFDPASNTFNGPYVAGGVPQAQYVAIDSNGDAWVADPIEDAIGVVDTTDPSGSNEAGFLTGINALGPIAADPTGALWFGYLDSSNTPNLGVEFEDDFQFPIAAFTYPPTGLAAIGDASGDDYIFAATSGSGTPCALEEAGGTIYAETTGNCTSGGIAYASDFNDVLSTATSLDQLCFAASGGCGPAPSAYSADINLPQGIATDGAGNEWLANSGNASVFTFGGVNTGYTFSSPVAYLHDASNGNTMTSPYAIAIDGSGNVWIANAGCVTTTTACTPTSFVLSELIGAAAPTITPLWAQGVDNGSYVGVLPGNTPLVSAVHSNLSHKQKPIAPKALSNHPANSIAHKLIAVRP